MFKESIQCKGERDQKQNPRKDRKSKNERKTGKLAKKVEREAGGSRVREYKKGELFYVTFNFDIISSLQKSCKNNTKFLNVFHPGYPSVNIVLHLL